MCEFYSKYAIQVSLMWGSLQFYLHLFYMTELIKLMEVENVLNVLPFIPSLKQIIKENSQSP